LIFVDSNIPMYLIGNDEARKRDAQLELERLAVERRQLVTSSEVFQELLHRYASAERREQLEVAFETLRAIVDEVLSIEEADVLAAKDVVHAHASMSARDAIHVAVMRRNQIEEILSFDRGFDAVTGITRLPAAG